MTTPTHANATAGNLIKALEDLDRGILNHTRWLKEIHRYLICVDETPQDNDLYPDAHCRCQFGQWYYYGEHTELDDLPQFTRIGGLHRSMHDTARTVLQNQLAANPIRSSQYDAFIDLSIQFKVEVRQLQHEIIQKVCVVDPLTGAWNRQSMHTHLSKEHERVLRKESHCTLCMLDVDYFKRVNDTYGHSVGDTVLRGIIERCNEQLRSYDSIFRYGGEEFLICMPEIDAISAETIIERLRQAIGDRPFVLDNGDALTVTASFGIAKLNKHKSLEDTIIEADHALLCAKSSGRNCICSWDR